MKEGDFLTGRVSCPGSLFSPTRRGTGSTSPNGTRLVQTVVDTTSLRAGVSPISTSAPSWERVVQGYQQSLGTEAAAMEIDGRRW
jgi:hypothetical protein